MPCAAYASAAARGRPRPGAPGSAHPSPRGRRGRRGRGSCGASTCGTSRAARVREAALHPSRQQPGSPGARELGVELAGQDALALQGAHEGRRVGGGGGLPAGRGLRHRIGVGEVGIARLQQVAAARLDVVPPMWGTRTSGGSLGADGDTSQGPAPGLSSLPRRGAAGPGRWRGSGARRRCVRRAGSPFPGRAAPPWRTPGRRPRAARRAPPARGRLDRARPALPPPGV